MYSTTAVTYALLLHPKGIRAKSIADFVNMNYNTVRKVLGQLIREKKVAKEYKHGVACYKVRRK